MRHGTLADCAVLSSWAPSEAALEWVAALNKLEIVQASGEVAPTSAIGPSGYRCWVRRAIREP